jgi:hypothetical protein
VCTVHVRAFGTGRPMAASPVSRARLFSIATLLSAARAQNAAVVVLVRGTGLPELAAGWLLPVLVFVVAALLNKLSLWVLNFGRGRSARRQAHKRRGAEAQGHAMRVACKTDWVTTPHGSKIHWSASCPSLAADYARCAASVARMCIVNPAEEPRLIQMAAKHHKFWSSLV